MFVPEKRPFRNMKWGKPESPDDAVILMQTGKLWVFDLNDK